MLQLEFVLPVVQIFVITWLFGAMVAPKTQKWGETQVVIYGAFGLVHTIVLTLWGLIIGYGMILGLAMATQPVHAGPFFPYDTILGWIEVPGFLLTFFTICIASKLQKNFVCLQKWYHSALVAAVLGIVAAITHASIMYLMVKSHT